MVAVHLTFSATTDKFSPKGLHDSKSIRIDSLFSPSHNIGRVDVVMCETTKQKWGITAWISAMTAVRSRS